MDVASADLKQTGGVSPSEASEIIKNGHPPVADGVVLIDFDATIAPFGYLFSYPEPIEGTYEFLKKLKSLGYTIGIFTSRLSPTWLESASQIEKEHIDYIFEYCNLYNLPCDFITSEKRPSIRYYDDKAEQFIGWDKATLPDSPINQANLAWFAGILEGEGNIDCGHRGNSVTIQIIMNDKDIIDRVHSLWGFGGRWEDKRIGRNTGYGWRVQSRDQVSLILNLVLPWLGIRRSARAKEALEFLKRNLGRTRDRTHCPQGHEYTTENIIKTSQNKRQCKTCTRIRSMDWYNRNPIEINKIRRQRYKERKLLNVTE